MLCLWLICPETYDVSKSYKVDFIIIWWQYVQYKKREREQIVYSNTYTLSIISDKKIQVTYLRNNAKSKLSWIRYLFLNTTYNFLWYSIQIVHMFLFYWFLLYCYIHKVKIFSDIRICSVPWVQQFFTSSVCVTMASLADVSLKSPRTYTCTVLHTFCSSSMHYCSPPHLNPYASKL